MEKVCCTTLPASLPLAWTRADRGLFLGMVEDAVQLTTSTIATLGSMVYTRALLTRLERRQEIYPDHMGEYMYPPKHSSTTVCPRCRHSRGVITTRGARGGGDEHGGACARARPAAAGAGVARASGPVRQRRRAPQRVGKVAGWLPEAVQESRPTQVETK